MNSFTPRILLICLLSAASLFSSCTTARWTVKSTDAVDRNEAELVEQELFLSPDGNLSPENPVLRLNLLSRNSYEYPRKVLIQRTMQDYRPRAGFMALGLAGAAVSFYAANSPLSEGEGSPARSITLNAAGAMLALSGFMNLKPVGEPRSTGEERYLRSTGTVIETDTAGVTETGDHEADVIVLYGERSIMEERGRALENGGLELQLANILDDLQLSGRDPGSVDVHVAYGDSTYSYSYPVRDILLPYADVTAPLAELRSTPEELQDNVMAELLQGSRLQVENLEEEGRWFRVLYGISENYILRNDARLIWHPSGFINNSNSVVTVPRIPFGNIDVENSIPVLRETRPNAYALIATNENYSGTFSSRSYSHRDGRLIKTYLRDALGYPAQNIFELQDIQNADSLINHTGRLKQAVNDSSELFIYINGYGEIDRDDDGYNLLLKTARPDSLGDGGGEIALSTFYRRLAEIPFRRMLVLNDIGFSSGSTGLNLSRSENRRIYDRHFSVLTRQNSGAAVITGSGIDQQPGLYVSVTGEDKKHHIFPYFFARALQQRRTDLPAIYQYLERNVSYTSRRLHDRSQDPMLLGTTSLDLTSE